TPRSSRCSRFRPAPRRRPTALTRPQMRWPEPAGSCLYRTGSCVKDIEHNMSVGGASTRGEMSHGLSLFKLVGGGQRFSAANPQALIAGAQALLHPNVEAHGFSRALSGKKTRALAPEASNQVRG